MPVTLEDKMSGEDHIENAATHTQVVEWGWFAGFVV
jgi:hypothetical protein